jgi:hypothetical protein
MTPSLYETPDVYLASYLLYQGVSFVGFERVGPRRTIFRFASSEYLHVVLRLYWNNERILVAPTQLFDSLRRLKSRIRRRPGAATGCTSERGTNTADFPVPHERDHLI